MSKVERDPERGRAVAAKLKALGVKGILIKAAEQGYITQLACKMPECFCPRGGPPRRGQRHPGAPPLQSHRLLRKCWPSVREDLERVRKAREEGYLYGLGKPNVARASARKRSLEKIRHRQAALDVARALRNRQRILENVR
jgi:hypothetical protein